MTWKTKKKNNETIKYKMINGDICECLKFGEMRKVYEWNYSQRFIDKDIELIISLGEYLSQVTLMFLKKNSSKKFRSKRKIRENSMLNSYMYRFLWTVKSFQFLCFQNNLLSNRLKSINYFSNSTVLL